MATDAGEWQSWLDGHGQSLLLFARQWVTSRSDAEDVVQEAFVRFWRSRQQAREPIAYLYQCVRNCALEWLRAGARRGRREEAVARGEETFFILQSEVDERRRLIETALSRLPAEQREVVVLKIWGGLSFAQIADTLELSANTAASRYRYALAKLREQLAEETIS
jgi:RNA polymerase sigma-70 factor (ECF subfamily)